MYVYIALSNSVLVSDMILKQGRQLRIVAEIVFQRYITSVPRLHRDRWGKHIFFIFYSFEVLVFL